MAQTTTVQNVSMALKKKKGCSHVTTRLLHNLPSHPLECVILKKICVIWVQRMKGIFSCCLLTVSKFFLPSHKLENQNQISSRLGSMKYVSLPLPKNIYSVDIGVRNEGEEEVLCFSPRYFQQNECRVVVRCDHFILKNICGWTNSLQVFLHV